MNLSTLNLASEPPPDSEVPAFEAPDPLVGTTLDGRYAIERVLGEGGMGLVYAARHVILNKRLAVKVLRPEVSKDEQVIVRFQREAQSATAIGSAHIIDISDFGNLPNGSTYFVMEFLDGPSLSDVIEEGPMDSQRVVQIAIQLCDALGAAHVQGIVHRDMKPDNVHLVPRGEVKDFVKVLDFGIAKVAGAADKKLTQAGQIFGTPHYMSPEQCSGREVNHQTDLYAVGVMLYEMSAGAVPFDADNLMGVLTKHVYEKPIPLRQLPSAVAVDPGLETIILRCLEKQLEVRYPDMEALKADLLLVSEGLPPSTGTLPPGAPHESGAPGALEVRPATPVSVEAPSRRPLWLGAIVSLSLLAAAVGAAALYLPGADDDQPPPPPALVEGPGPQTADTPEPEIAETAEAEAAEAEAAEAETAEAETPEEVTVAEPAPLHLSSDPVGAEVYRDEQLLGNTPLPLQRPEAEETYTLVLRQPGYQERQFRVSRLTGEQVSVRMERVRRRSRRRRPAPFQPRVQSLAGPAPSPATPAPTRHYPTAGSEIINPF